MAPFSHAWLVFVALVAVGEASVGDRSWLFVDCLDICVEKMCGITYVREELDFELTRAEKTLRKRLRNQLHNALAEREAARTQQEPGLAGLPETTPRTTGAFVAGDHGDAARPQERRRRLLTGADGVSVTRQERNVGLEQEPEEGRQQDHDHRHQQQPQQRRRQLQQQPEGGGGGDNPEQAGAAAAVAAAGAMSGGGGSVGEGVRASNGVGHVPADTLQEGVGDQVRRALTAEDLLAGEDGGKGGQGAAAGAVPGAMVAEGASGGVGAVDRYVHQPPWYLRAMGWDCESECRHMCMNLHVEMRAATGSRMVQYYGKWPFRRVWGIQELFASLFSAGNGLPHLYHVLFSKGLYNPPGNYMRFWLTIYPWVGMNTWLWSTVFHARDVPWTEAADYFCALLNIFYVVWIALVRLAGPPAKRSPRARRVVPVVGVSMSVYYLLHISFMWFVKFDYGYNMKVALLAGVAHTGLWLRYLYLVRDRSYARRGATIIILLNAAILLEVNDFPPLYRLLDAHAIWHFVTIPLMFCWYRFVIQDARHEVSMASKET